MSRRKSIVRMLGHDPLVLARNSLESAIAHPEEAAGFIADAIVFIADAKKQVAEKATGLVKCPAGFYTATVTFDPAGYDPFDCAGCGCALEEHLNPEDQTTPASETASETEDGP